MGQNALEMVTATLKAMANGGIHDHVGQVCVCERERERENEGVCVCGVSTYVLCTYSNSILSFPLPGVPSLFHRRILARSSF